MMFKALKRYLFNKIDKRAVATRADELLQNEAFAIAVDAVQEHILSMLVSTSLEDRDARERLYHQYKAVDDVLIELSRLINNVDQPLMTETLDAESHQGEQNGR